MKRRLVTTIMLLTAASLLSGCIFTNWHDHGRGNAYGHDKSRRGGGGGRR